MAQVEQVDEPLEVDDDEDNDNEPAARVTKVKRHLKTSGPKTVDPYAEDQSSSLLPFALALAAVIPVIFCLCRL